VPGIFISYRRGDAGGYAGRLYDQLSQVFGPERVFMDIDTLAPGADFVEHIRNAIRSADAVLALIGHSWIEVRDDQGHRRLDNPTDVVRLELAAGLEHGILVIPVLVNGAKMPRPDDLPEELRPLAGRNALDLTDLHWRAEVERLIRALQQGPTLPSAPSTTDRPDAERPPEPAPVPQKSAYGSRTLRQRRWVLAAMAAALAAIALLALLIGQGGGHRVRAGTVRDTIKVGSIPQQVAVGFGAVWVVSTGDRKLYRIDIATGKASATVAPVGPQPVAVAVGSDSIWVTSATHGQRGELARIDPLRETRLGRPILVGHYPFALAVGAGTVWVANYGDGTVTPVDERSGRIEPPVTVGPHPEAVEVSGRTLWVTDDAYNTVVGIDVRTHRRSIGPIAVSREPAGLAVGAGSVWVTHAVDNSVSRIDLRTHQRVATIPVSGAPEDVAVGLGSVWVTSQDGNRVVQLDPRSNRVVSRIAVGKAPVGVAVGARSVWVTNSDSDSVTRIEP
jgi:YVTN family beta-propeller protein